MSFSFVEMWHSMGALARVVVIALGMMSTWSLGVILERWLAYLRARRQSDAYVARLRDLMKDGKLDAAAQAADGAVRSPLARVVAAGLREVLRGGDAGKDEVAEAVQRAVERVRERQLSDLRRGLGSLATIGSVAPFVGLFGTVVGIINAFRSMASTGSGGLGAVSAGIAEALVTTAFGLLVAIPAVWMFNVFSTQVDAFVVDMNEASAELVDHVLRPGGSRK